jgi:hypothetical protein
MRLIRLAVVLALGFTLAPLAADLDRRDVAVILMPRPEVTLEAME